MVVMEVGGVGWACLCGSVLQDMGLPVEVSGSKTSGYVLSVAVDDAKSVRKYLLEQNIEASDMMAVYLSFVVWFQSMRGVGEKVLRCQGTGASIYQDCGGSLQADCN